MKNPKRVIVSYIRKTKDGKHEAQIIGFAYTPDISLCDNVEAAVGFVESIHNDVCVCSVVLKY